ncbi:MAG: hypothetical protein ACO3HF_00965 [Burkholderiaceae bacterium]
MFFFGTPEDTAGLYWRNSTEIRGPEVAAMPVDEMSEQQLRNAITYCRIAYKKAVEDEAEEEVLSLLLEQHDEVFKALAEASEDFRLRVKNRYCIPITGFTPESVEKYRKLAGVSD